MARALQTPGKYPAKIIDFGIWKGKKGPSAAVMFRYTAANGAQEEITWFGSFNGGAREYTVETLLRMGFNGSNGAELNKGNGSGVLDQQKEFEIVVQNEPNPMKGGELQSRVAFVNLPGGGAFRDKLAEEGEAAVLMGGLNLGADFMAARQKISQGHGSHRGGPTPSPQMQASFSQGIAGAPTEDDIPF